MRHQFLEIDLHGHRQGPLGEACRYFVRFRSASLLLQMQHATANI